MKTSLARAALAGTIATCCFAPAGASATLITFVFAPASSGVVGQFDVDTDTRRYTNVDLRFTGDLPMLGGGTAPYDFRLNSMAADTVEFTAPFLSALPGLSSGFPIFGGKTGLAPANASEPALAFASSKTFQGLLDLPVADPATAFGRLIGMTFNSDWQIGLVGSNKALLGLGDVTVSFKVIAGALPGDVQSAVPEPSTQALAALGLLMAVGLRRRARADRSAPMMQVPLPEHAGFNEPTAPPTVARLARPAATPHHPRICPAWPCPKGLRS